MIETVVSAIPYVGGPATRFFNLVITPPLERRLNEWRNTVAERILRLEGKVEGFKVEDLGKNPMFITAVMQATQIALRNHQKEKLEALQNAVANSAMGIDIEQDLQLMFLNLVDSFTILHLRLLTYLNNPQKWLQDHGLILNLVMGGVSSGLELAFPELKDQRYIYDPIVQDLYNRGLLHIDKSSLHATVGTTGMTESRTTELGRKFLGYISKD
jgi:hypothetical protein